jgi:hypothetical protein
VQRGKAGHFLIRRCVVNDERARRRNHDDETD